MSSSVDEHAGTWTAANPYLARLANRRALNRPGSAKDTRHIEIDVSGSGLTYDAGDSLGVTPANDPHLVQAVLAAAGIDGSAPVRIGEADVEIGAALMRREITKIAKPLLQLVGERSQAPLLASLLTPSAKEGLKAWLDGRDVLDLLADHHGLGLGAQEFVDSLRPLAPRLYSIASSPSRHPESIHLTVALAGFEAHGRFRAGVASHWLGKRIDDHGEVPVFLHRTKHFRLPESSDTGAIMVGPGTGIAPFRAFLQAQEDRGATRNWLFFGDQRRFYDYLYEDEIEGWRQRGVLQRLDLAFSRDQAEKVYVQHQMLAQAAELWRWLQEGAHFYVCGDAGRMAKDVDAALHQIAREQGGLDEDGAKAWVTQLRKDRRYQRDVYAVG